MPSSGAGSASVIVPVACSFGTAPANVAPCGFENVTVNARSVPNSPSFLDFTWTSTLVVPGANVSVPDVFPFDGFVTV